MLHHEAFAVKVGDELYLSGNCKPGMRGKKGVVTEIDAYFKGMYLDRAPRRKVYFYLNVDGQIIKRGHTTLSLTDPTIPKPVKKKLVNKTYITKLVINDEVEEQFRLNPEEPSSFRNFDGVAYRQYIDDELALQLGRALMKTPATETTFEDVSNENGDMTVYEVAITVVEEEI